LRQTSSIIYLAVDDLLSPRGNFPPGFDEFSAALDHAGIPCVWLSSRTRLQLDEPRRRMNHTHPFIAEDGCGVFLPEDYFHLRPQASATRKRGANATVRLGRFTCLPVAEQQPAAETALEEIAAETDVSVVPIRSLPPKQLAQNLGLAQKEAELARQRDFDELFFFAGATAEQMKQFDAAARSKGIALRPRGALWSLAVGASLPRCIQELSKLYDRALHAHARTIGIAAASDTASVPSACDRVILLTRKGPAEKDAEPAARRNRRATELALNSPDLWERLLAELSAT
jgi:mannosyl-3-phosphoglycerate phosphatase